MCVRACACVCVCGGGCWRWCWWWCCAFGVHLFEVIAIRGFDELEVVGVLADGPIHQHVPQPSTHCPKPCPQNMTRLDYVTRLGHVTSPVTSSNKFARCVCTCGKRQEPRNKERHDVDACRLATRSPKARQRRHISNRKEMAGNGEESKGDSKGGRARDRDKGFGKREGAGPASKAADMRDHSSGRSPLSTTCATVTALAALLLHTNTSSITATAASLRHTKRSPLSTT